MKRTSADACHAVSIEEPRKAARADICDPKTDDDDSLDDLFGEDLFSDPDDEDEDEDETDRHAVFRRALAKIDLDEECAAQKQTGEAEVPQGFLHWTAVAEENADDWALHSSSYLDWFCRIDGTLGLTMTSVREALHKLKGGRDLGLPLWEIVRLLRAAARPGGLASDTAIREISIPSTSEGSGRIMIVGDTHGQLEDVLWILFKHGEPSATSNIYLFNGDVVDRGIQAVEIFLLIVLYSLAEPGSVYMNRGNHEDRIQTSSHGFQDECRRKFGVDYLLVYNLFMEVFNTLALGSVVDAGEGRRMLIVHGGIPRRATSLAELSRVNFRREIPLPAPGEDELFFDCMWSDPWPSPGIGPNVRGMRVASFGPDITQAFLKATTLDLVVRSHAVPAQSRGFEWHHGGHVLTVFSASNYVGRFMNLGGVVAVRKGEPVETSEHWAGSLTQLRGLEARAADTSTKLRAVRCVEKLHRRRSFSSGLQKMQVHTLDHVKERLVARKGELFEYWAARDDSADFHVSAEVWRQGMSHCLGADLPWEWVEEELAVVDASSGLVPYTRFLSRYRVAQVGDHERDPASSDVLCSPTRPVGHGWEGALIRCVFESLLRADFSLRDALAVLDPDADGVVSAEDLAAIAEDCGVVLSFRQCRALFRSFAVHRAGRPGGLRLFDILDGLTVEFSAICRAAAIGAEEWVPKALGKIAWVLLADASALNMERSEVAELQPSQTLALTDAYSYEPRCSEGGGDPPTKCSTVAATSAHDQSAAAVAHADTLVPARPAMAELLAAWFRKADSDGNGYLSVDELEAALARLEPELQRQGVPSDRTARRAIVSYMDFDGNGQVNYLELLASMAVCQVGDREGKLGPLGEDLVESIAVAIHTNRVSLLRTLRARFDPGRTGRVTAAEFSDALAAVSGDASNASTRTAEAGLLPIAQIETLASELSGFGGGAVEYEEFIGSFAIVEGLG